MALTHKITNLLTLLAIAIFLHYSYSSFHQSHSYQELLIHATRQIATGTTLSDSMVEQIQHYIQQGPKSNNTDNSWCLILAYYQIVVKQKIEVGDLFAIFTSELQQFDGVTECSHYLELMLSRASKMESNRKEVVGIISGMYVAQLEKKYPTKGNENKICVYMHVYNQQSTIKQQLETILAQNYQNFQTVISNDGSTDNTPVFIKYALEESNQQSVYHQQTQERKGLIQTLKSNIHQCAQQSIVVVISGNDYLLGEYSLWAINRIFNNQQLDVAFLGTLTATHSNIQTITSSSQPFSVISPAVAFRKKVGVKLQDSKSGIQKDKGALWLQKDKSILERNMLAVELLRVCEKVKIVNEGIMFRVSKASPSVYEQLGVLASEHSL